MDDEDASREDPRHLEAREDGTIDARGLLMPKAPQPPEAGPVPKTYLAKTIRCTSLVPSPISHSLASLKARSTGKSLV